MIVPVRVRSTMPEATASAWAAMARWKSATAEKLTPGMRNWFMAESVCAPVAMTTSPTATRSLMPPAVPTRMMRSTP